MTAPSFPALPASEQQPTVAAALARDNNTATTTPRRQAEAAAQADQTVSAAEQREQAQREQRRHRRSLTFKSPSLVTRSLSLAHSVCCCCSASRRHRGHSCKQSEGRDHSCTRQTTLRTTHHQLLLQGDSISRAKTTMQLQQTLQRALTAFSLFVSSQPSSPDAFCRLC